MGLKRMYTTFSAMPWQRSIHRPLAIWSALDSKSPACRGQHIGAEGEERRFANHLGVGEAMVVASPGNSYCEPIREDVAGKPG